MRIEAESEGKKMRERAAHTEGAERPIEEHKGTSEGKKREIEEQPTQRE